MRDNINILKGFGKCLEKRKVINKGIHIQKQWSQLNLFFINIRKFTKRKILEYKFNIYIYLTRNEYSRTHSRIRGKTSWGEGNFITQWLNTRT